MGILSQNDRCKRSKDFSKCDSATVFFKFWGHYQIFIADLDKVVVHVRKKRREPLLTLVLI